MTVQERREKLLGWLRDKKRAYWPPMTTWEIATGTPIAWWRDPGVRRYCSSSRASRDLRALEREGNVRRLPGRPARWEAV